MQVPTAFALGQTRSPLPAVATAQTARARMILPHQSQNWHSQQVEEPCILTNPKNPRQLIMFFSGVPADNKSVALIGKAWADVSAPLNWHYDSRNPIFGPGRGWDSGTIRLDSVVYVQEEDAYYIYYSGTIGSIQDRIGLAIVPAGPDGYSNVTEANIRRYGVGPILAPNDNSPFNETMVSQGAVTREWNPAKKVWNWYLYYSYRGSDGVLPGIRMAVSTDGKRWARWYNPKDPSGRGQIFPGVANTYYEWHQIFKVGSTYVLSIEAGPENGKRWRTALATSESPFYGWKPLNLDLLLQTQWKGLYREESMFHVATPAFYRIEDKWYLFVQACGRPGSNNYIDGTWDLWAMECTRKLQLNERDSIDVPR
jgi:hypothetical protein